MGIGAMFDSLADQFAQQYRALLTSITGHFARALDEYDPTTPKARSDFRANLLKATDTFMSGMSVQIEVHTNNVRDAALSTVERPLSDPQIESLNEYLRDSMDDLGAALYACLHRDDMAAERELRNVALRVDLLQASTGISKVGALIKSKFGRVSSLNFIQVDRLGRKRVSDSFVRSLVRRHFVLAYAESQIFAIAKSGIDLAQVVKEDGTLGDTVFSITGATPGYPSYEEIRDDIFHPNSSASVIAFKG